MFSSLSLYYMSVYNCKKTLSFSWNLHALEFNLEADFVWSLQVRTQPDPTPWRQLCVFLSRYPNHMVPDF